MTSAQAALWEPTGAEVGVLAMQHAARADKARKLAHLADIRGWVALGAAYRAQAADEEQEAACFAMLAEFERLGGIV